MQDNSSSNSPETQLTIAPSEKHLEDWLCSQYMFDEGFWNRIVGRQVKLPSGICDMLVIRNHSPNLLSLTVVEAKKGDLNSEALAQCLRYMGDLKCIYYDVRYPFNKDDEHIYDDYHDYNLVSECLGYPLEITGMLVGHSMRDNNLKIACKAAGVEAWSYTYTDGEYDIDWIDTETTKNSIYDSSFIPSYKLIEGALHEVLQQRLKKQNTRLEGES